jgi:hypothetical protein
MLNPTILGYFGRDRRLRGDPHRNGCLKKETARSGFRKVASLIRRTQRYRGRHSDEFGFNLLRVLLEAPLVGAVLGPVWRFIPGVAGDDIKVSIAVDVGDGARFGSTWVDHVARKRETAHAAKPSTAIAIQRTTQLILVTASIRASNLKTSSMASSFRVAPLIPLIANHRWDGSGRSRAFRTSAFAAANSCWNFGLPIILPMMSWAASLLAGRSAE